jgi:2-polyprenyl-3-methyl-5-hydroxy-6-metoxy-1,4-benzoquinol methylase
MNFENLVPWRIRHRVNRWLESSLRRRHTDLYKLIKFGRRNLNTPEYWNDVWRNDTTDRSYAALFDAILERVPTGARILDVGCGAGHLARLLRERREARVTALDFSAWACAQLAQEGFETVVSTLPTIPLPDGTFDVAIATEVLEHLDTPNATVREMAHVVRAGGLVMCSVPNDSLHPHEELEHQHAFTEASLRAMFAPVVEALEIRMGKMSSSVPSPYLLAAGRVVHA